MFLWLSIAQADLLPPPKCKEGTHHVYNMGHHCVKNGYTLVERDGRLVEEKLVTEKLLEIPPEEVIEKKGKDANPEEAKEEKSSKDKSTSNSQSPGCRHLAPIPYAGIIMLSVWVYARRRSIYEQ